MSSSDPWNQLAFSARLGREALETPFESISIKGSFSFIEHVRMYPPAHDGCIRPALKRADPQTLEIATLLAQPFPDFRQATINS